MEFIERQSFIQLQQQAQQQKLQTVKTQHLSKHICLILCVKINQQ